MFLKNAISLYINCANGLLYFSNTTTLHHILFNAKIKTMKIKNKSNVFFVERFLFCV